MHGGLFKRDDVKLEELRTIDRNRQPGEEGGYFSVKNETITNIYIYSSSR